MLGMLGMMSMRLSLWMLIRRSLVLRWIVGRLLSRLRIIGTGTLVGWSLREMTGGRVCVGHGRPRYTGHAADLWCALNNRRAVPVWLSAAHEGVGSQSSAVERRPGRYTFAFVFIFGWWWRWRRCG